MAFFQRKHGNTFEMKPTKDTISSEKKNRLRQVFLLVLILVSLGFVAAQIFQGHQELANRHWEISAWKFICSLGLLMVNFLFTAIAWSVIFDSLGQPISVLRSFAVVFVSAIGRYIPGKIWMVLGQISVAAKWNYKSSTVLTAGAVHIFCGALGASLVFIATTIAMGQMSWMTGLVALFFAFGLLTLLAAPSFLEKWINKIRSKKGGEPICLRVSPAAVFKVTGIMTAVWVINCVAFALLVASLTSVGPDAWLDLAYAFNLAYWAGFAILILPGGIGVREGVLTLLLTGPLGPAGAGIVALCQRLWLLLAELIAFGVATIIYKRDHKPPLSEP